ncbi:MAG: translocase [Roseivivax sp.]|nr:translocase [Roseivivax sp.]
MTRLKSLSIALATVLFALTIGYVMQYKLGPSRPVSLASAEEIAVTALTPTSSAAPMPRGDTLRVPPGAATLTAEVTRARVDSGQQIEPPAACLPRMTATATVSAMADLTLDAPCQPNAAVTFHHSGLMFTETTDDAGQITLTVPVLSRDAVFIAAFDNGDGAVAQLQVEDIGQIDRVAVQWEGETGLQLHALEFGADYFNPGHIWAQSAGLPQQANAGFLVQLGNPALPHARLAEVYTFPAGKATRSGTVSMSIEAEVTQANCGQRIDAQTMEMHLGGLLQTQDLSLSLPECTAVGEFLVLKNTVQDLKIAAR